MWTTWMRTIYDDLRLYGHGQDMWRGLIGTSAIAVGSWGAGAKMHHGSWMQNGPLEWLRFGHGQFLSQAFFWVGVVLLLMSWLRIGSRLLLSHTSQLRGSSLVALTGLWSAPLLCAAPLLSRDIYSYLAQGALLVAGHDPYAVGPDALNTEGHLHPLYLEVSGDWRNTTTPYGPVHMGLMSLIVRVTHGNIHAGIIIVKLLCSVSLLVIAWAAGQLAGLYDQDPAVGVWMAAAHPIALLHIVGGMHNEAWMVALMGVGLVCVARHQHLLGIVLITIGAAVKATALIACPFVVWIWVAHLRVAYLGRDGHYPSRGRTVGYFVGTAAGGAAVSVGVFALLQVMASLGTGFLQALAGSAKVINWLTLPTAFAHFVGLVGSTADGPSFMLSLESARAIFSLIMAVLLLVVWWHYRQNPLQALRGLALAFLVICLTNSLAFPWYYTWILLLVGSLRIPLRYWPIIAAASAWGTFTVMPNGIITLYNWGWMGVAAVAALSTYWVWRHLQTEDDYAGISSSL